MTAIICSNALSAYSRTADRFASKSMIFDANVMLFSFLLASSHHKLPFPTVLLLFAFHLIILCSLLHLIDY